jgi:hypothetical protein
MKILNNIACRLNSMELYSLNSNGILNRFEIQIQLKKNVIQIDAQNIISIAHSSPSSSMTMMLKKHRFEKKHFFIPFRANSKSKSILA